MHLVTDRHRLRSRQSNDNKESHYYLPRFACIEQTHLSHLMPIGALFVFSPVGHGIQVGLDKPRERHLTQRYGLQERGKKIALPTC